MLLSSGKEKIVKYKWEKGWRGGKKEPQHFLLNTMIKKKSIHALEWKDYYTLLWCLSVFHDKQGAMPRRSKPQSAVWQNVRFGIEHITTRKSKVGLNKPCYPFTVIQHPKQGKHALATCQDKAGWGDVTVSCYTTARVSQNRFWYEENCMDWQWKFILVTGSSQGQLNPRVLSVTNRAIDTGFPRGC